MELKQKLEKALHDAMKSGDDVTKRTVRMVLASIKMSEIEKRVQLDDPTIVNIIQKEIKSRMESNEDAKRGNRIDVIEENLKEIKVLEAFLPAQLSEKEISDVVKKAIADVQANGASDMGKVMKVVLPALQGKAANDKISKIVKEMLSNS